jgi:hypothetical protein
VLSHLQRALTPQPSRRWTPLIARRAVQLKYDGAQAIAASLAAACRDAARPAAWLAAFVKVCDAELALLDQRQSEARAKLRQAEKELEPLQARVNAFLQANASRHTITRLVELLTALLQAVDRGVGLTAVVLMAERLVNDRESQAFNLDTAAAAAGILQEIRAQAQAERERIGQFQAGCRAAAEQAAGARTAILARLTAHPYADVDMTDAALAERLQAHIQPAAAPGLLHDLLDLDGEQLYRQLFTAAVAQVRQQTLGLSMTELMDMQAAGMLGEEIDDDLSAATLEAAYRRTGIPSIELGRKASPQEWQLVGVLDETNPGFAFEQATLVGTGRRDQIQFMRVQVGIALQDLLAFSAVRESFEQAAAQRNYYVLDALAADDHARRAFALGLASGIIAVHEGAFALDGQHQLQLGLTVEDALDYFIQRTELVRLVEDEFNALPLVTAAERMESYLARGQAVQDVLWWELASYVRERLELAQHQLTFAGEQL